MSTAIYKVGNGAALGLFIRSEPVVKDSTKLAVLPAGHVVTKLAATDGWFEVETTLDGSRVRGFISAKYLTPATEKEPTQAVKSITAVHLTTNQSVRRNNTLYAYPLNEPGQPTRDVTAAPSEQVKQLTAIIRHLAVDKHARYHPKPSATYCNIYGTDYCYLAGVYLPRVWWLSSAIARLKAGHAVSPVYGQSVAEVNANSLLIWLKEFGSMFGWKRSFDLTELQNAANAGKVVVIVAQQKQPNRSGHIAVVAPETTNWKAKRSGSKVTTPLQSQAGRTNRQYWTPPAWWTGSQYKEFGFWINQ